MHVNKIRFGILAILLFLYVAGVLILSVVTLHEPRSLSNLKRERHEQLTRLKTFDYAVAAAAVGGQIISSSGHGGGGGSGSVLRPSLRRSRIQWCTTLKYLNPPQPDRIALASFPGSGNTWLRYLLQQSTGYYTGSIYKDYGLLKNGFPAENISNRSVLVVKTHEWGRQARQFFNKAILLVRRPGAAIQAEFNRQSGGHIGFASPDRYKRTKGKYWQQFVDNKLESWKQTNLDWLYNFTGPTHIIFYEQLINNLETTLRSIIEFLNLPLDEKLFKCALERKEGIYRRKRRVLNFDPYTERMKQKLHKYQQEVYEAIYNFASPAAIQQE